MRRSLLLPFLALPLAHAQDLEWTVPGAAYWPSAWNSVDMTPDVDGDGLADVIAGNFNVDDGSVTVHSGHDGSVIHSILGAPPIEGIGYTVAGLGDVDGDGRGDIAAASWSGWLQVYSGADASLLWSWSGGIDSPHIRALGDVNLDGFPDLGVGWWQSTNGMAQVYSGKAIAGQGGSTILWSVTGAQPGGNFGYALAPMGDVDGDGAPDVLVGANDEQGVLSGVPYRGRVHLLSGATGSSIWISYSVGATQIGYGTAVCGTPDVTGDGVPDWMVGAPLINGNTGTVYLRSGAVPFLVDSVDGAQAGGYFGSSLAALEDGDGDGAPEFLVGAPLANGGTGTLGIYTGVPLTELETIVGVDWLAGQRGLAGGRDATGDGRPDFAVANSQIHNVGAGPLELWSFGCAPAEAYCSGLPNSVQPDGAEIHLLGSASLGENQASLFVERCVPGQPGVFYYGDAQLSMPFGHGIRCVGGQTLRLDPPVICDGNGEALLDLDLSAPPFSSGPGEVSPGDLRNFQFWYRDPGAGAPGFNLTNAVAVLFCS